MQRKLLGFVVAALAVIPLTAFAGNQQIAERIAQKLRESGQMSDYKIGVKFQDGTAWLRGRVSSEEQMDAALRLTFEISNVDRVVNDLTVAASEENRPQPKENAKTDDNPLRNAAPRPLAANQAPSAVRTVANEEPQELAPEMPQARQAKPMRVAMHQNVRGPTAPNGAPLPMYQGGAAPANAAPAKYDQPCMPNYAWPSYAAYPNYAAVTYPKQYSPTAWPYIGPFYPYPQVPLGWRKVTLEWDSGWWYLDFKDQPASCWHR